MCKNKRNKPIIKWGVICVLITVTFVSGAFSVQVSATGDQNNRLKTLNDGTDLMPLHDTTGVSDADIFGFSLTREGTESESYGDRNLMNDWIGAVPGELVIMNEDNAFNLTDLDFVKSFTSDGELPDYDENGRDDYLNFITDNNATGFEEGKRSSYHALRAIDLDRNGLDDLVYLTEDGTLQFYDATRLMRDGKYKSNMRVSFDHPLYEFQLSGSTADYLANKYPDTGKASEKDTANYIPLLQGINEHHMEVGDVDGNGCEDVVVFYYGEKGPVMEVYYLFYLDYITLNSSMIAGMPAGWTGYEAARDTERYMYNMIAYHEVIDLPLYAGGDYFGHLPASLQVEDLSGDGMSEIILAYQEGNPASSSGTYRTNLAVYHSEKEKDVKLSLLKGSNETKTFTQPKLVGDVKAWTPEDQASTQMTSAAVGDIDNDGYPELAIGGYAGENALDGELYLCYMEWKYKNDTDMTGYLDREHILGFTWMNEENGLHEVNGDAEFGSKRTDTSLFEEDSDSKFFSANGTAYTLSRYVNSSNWTVPLTAVSLSGYVQGQTWDQVQFGNGCYGYDASAGKFAHYLKSGNSWLVSVNNNNMTVLLSEDTVSEDMLPQCSDEEVLDQMTDYGGEEVLYQAAIITIDGKDAFNAHLVYYEEGSQIKYNSYIAPRHRENPVYHAGERVYDLNDRASFTTPVIGNFEIEEKTAGYSVGSTRYEKAVGADADSLMLKLVGHDFTYSEPVVESVLIAPPTFEDIYAATGYDSGSTSLTNIDGTSSDGSVSATFAFDFTLAAQLKIGKNETMMGSTPGFSVSPTYKAGTTKDSQFTVSTSKGQDTVVITCVPVDTYYYEIIRPGTHQTTNDMYDYEVLDYAVLHMPSSPQIQTVSFAKYAKMVKEYNEKTANYNEQMNAYSEENDLEFVELPYLPKVREFASHTWGKPDTYKKISDINEDHFKDDKTLLTLNYSNDFGTTTQSLLRTWKTQEGYTAGETLKAGFKFEKGNRFTKFSLGATGSLSCVGGQTFYEGTAYKGDLKSISEEWDDFGMQVSMYSGKKEAQVASADGLEASEYTIVGYETHNVKYGTAVADRLKVKDVKAHQITLEAKLPWDSENAAQAYVLQRFNANTHRWETIHIFREPNQAGKNKAAVETFVDKGGGDGSGADGALEAGTTYFYRLCDPLQKHSITAKGTTKAMDIYTIHYQELFNWGLPLVRATSAATGWVNMLTDGATIESGSKITYSIIPFEECSVTEIRVLETVDGVEADITNMDRVTITENLRKLTIEDVQGDIQILVDGDNPHTVIKDDTWDMILESMGITIYSNDASILTASGDVSSDRLSGTLQDAGWIIDSDARVKISSIAGHESITFFMRDGEGELLHKTLVPSEDGSIKSTTKNLPDGAYYILAIGKSKESDVSGKKQISTKFLPVRKDAVKPEVRLASIHSPASNGSKMILVGADVGPSGVAKVEIAAGKDAAEGFMDVTSVWKTGIDRYGEQDDPVKNGWYTVRLTNGAGVATTASINTQNIAVSDEIIIPDDENIQKGGNTSNKDSGPDGAADTGDTGMRLMVFLFFTSAAAISSILLMQRQRRR